MLAPLLGMLGYYFWKFYPTYSIADFLKIVFTERTLLTAISTFSLFANVALLTFYFNTRKDETAKGIFIISCLYAVAALIAKFFM